MSETIHNDGIEDPHSITAFGDMALDSTCSNCKCEFPSGLKHGSKDAAGRTICCAHCVFNPLGCRCQYAEFGVAETVQFIDEDEDDDDEEDEDEEDDLDDDDDFDFEDDEDEELESDE